MQMLKLQIMHYDVFWGSNIVLSKEPFENKALWII